MKHNCMLWAGHIFVSAFLLGGIGWIVRHLHSMSEYNLFMGLAAMTVLVLNHYRWWVLGKKVDCRDVQERIDLLVVANYCVFFFILQLIDFHG